MNIQGLINYTPRENQRFDLVKLRGPWVFMQGGSHKFVTLLSDSCPSSSGSSVSKGQVGTLLIIVIIF